MAEDKKKDCGCNEQFHEVKCKTEINEGQIQHIASTIQSNHTSIMSIVDDKVGVVKDQLGEMKDEKRVSQRFVGTLLGIVTTVAVSAISFTFQSNAKVASLEEANKSKTQLITTLEERNSVLSQRISTVEGQIQGVLQEIQDRKDIDALQTGQIDKLKDKLADDNLKLAIGNNK